MTPLTPTESPSDSRIVVDCAVCHRTIWHNSRCTHGVVALEPVVPKDDQVLIEPGDDASKTRKGRK